MKLNLLRHKDHPDLSLMNADGVMLLVDPKGPILDKSPISSSLAELWTSGSHDLSDLVAAVTTTGVPGQRRITQKNGAHFWVAASPVADSVLLVANDTSHSDKVMEALVESRKLLRNLLSLATEFAFEVDANQHFTFVSPESAFGCDTVTWLGENATKIFWPEGKHPARNPFGAYTKHETQPVEVYLSETGRQVVFSVEPVLSDNGTFLGVRGTCRDVTERLMKLQEARLDSLRLSVQQTMTRHLNTTENAQTLLDNASEELMAILRADLVWSIMKYHDRLVPAALCGEYQHALDFDSIWMQVKGDEQYVQLVEDGDRTHLVVRLTSSMEDIGMVVISRDTQISPWSKQEVQLLEAMGDVLTAAFTKAQLIERLYRLSGKDDLTGLLNRRALVDVVEQRLKLQKRTGQTGCLMFLDLDNFKEVNDTMGHDIGDKAIRLVAEKMELIIRSSDVAGRFGGDEFVLWLENASVKVAETKAKQMLDYMPTVRAKLGNTDLKLGVSVGVAQSVPGLDMKFDDLTKRADEALYKVKKSGKNSVAVADMPVTTTGG